MSSIRHLADMAGKAMTGFLIISTVGLFGAAGYGIFSFTVLRKIAQREAMKQKQAEAAVSGAHETLEAAPAEAGEERR
jgi:flagellar biosynthesis/type III secretory pathway M-ring protein FliF/YscJ